MAGYSQQVNSMAEPSQPDTDKPSDSYALDPHGRYFSAQEQTGASGDCGLHCVRNLLESDDESLHPAVEHSARTFARTVTRLYEAWLSRDDPLDWWNADAGADAGATDIPPPLQYPVQHCAFPFCKALCHMFFGLNILENARGLFMLVSAMMIPTPKVLLKGEKKD